MSCFVIDVLALTQALIRCRSVTPDDDGAQGVLKQALKTLGFTVYDLPFEGDGSYPVQNFFARLGTGAPHFCYAGHTDVVPAGDEDAWTHPPFEAVIDGDILYGRGTSDMKGANAAFVTALSQFLEKKPDFDGSLSVLITGDEEADAINGTQKVLQWMAENNHIPDYCLVGESSNIKELGEEIKIGRRGSRSGTLTVTGKQGHVAYQHLVDNPLPVLAKIATALSDLHFDDGTEHFPPTNLEITTIDVGNKAGNVIPAAGSLRFNIRFNTEWNTETLDQKIHDTLQAISPDYDLTMSGNAQPFLTEPSEWVQNIAKIIEQETGRPPALTTGGGTSDARFIAPYCPVLEFGLTNETIHQVDECCKISDLKALVGIYEKIMAKTLSIK